MKPYIKLFLLIFTLLSLTINSSAQQQATNATASVSINPIPSIEIIDFNIIPKQTTQNSYIDFYVAVKNTGNVEIDVTPNIVIWDPNSNRYSVEFDSETIQPTLNTTFYKQWFTSNYPFGTYLAVLTVSYDSLYETQTDTFYIGNITQDSQTSNVIEKQKVMVDSKIKTSTTLEFVTNITLGTIEINITQGQGSLVPNTSLAKLNITGLRYINITTTKTLNETTLTWNLIKIHYNSLELDSFGIVEDSLSMYLYNSTSNQWIKLTPELNYVFATGINTIEDFVWANLTHLSVFAIGGLKTNGQSCSANVECFSGICCSGICRDSCPMPAPQTPPAAPPVQEILPPPEAKEIKFVRFPILKEARLGETILIDIEVSNPTDLEISGLKVEVKGIPEEWVRTTPRELTVEKGKKESFTKAITIPSDAWPGDYRVSTIASNDEVYAESFFILRIKPYTTKFERPTFTRSVEVDRDLEATKVSISINNGPSFIDSLKVREKISKTIAKNVDEILFSIKPTRIIEYDPIVEWELQDLEPNERRMITYQVFTLPKEYSPYVYWPIKEVIISPKLLEELVKIVKIFAQEFFLGRFSEVEVSIANSGGKTIDLLLKIETPPNWDVKPSEIRTELSAYEKQIYKFKVKPPIDAITGFYELSLHVFYGKRQLMRNFMIIVKEIPIWTFSTIYLIILLMVGIFSTGSIILYKISRKPTYPLSKTLRILRKLKEQIEKRK